MANSMPSAGNSRSHILSLYNTGFADGGSGKGSLFRPRLRVPGHAAAVARRSGDMLANQLRWAVAYNVPESRKERERFLTIGQCFFTLQAAASTQRFFNH